ncbi:hypothetical protein [Microbulbifer elongatus]|uniref:hypothetical protein n=1 Tax=Microbulbifer elongatus TaxID=86173 RepID=UPI001CFD7A15|nr:hypothetical protein [Microbulbifer elongatus]
MNRALFIALAFSFQVSATEDPEILETVWHKSESELSCSSTELNPSETLQVKLGGHHGSELAVYRHDDNLWLFMVVGSPPTGMVSLMSPQEFEGAKSFVISPKTTGYRWDSVGANEVIFSKPGKYTLYVSENLESELGGYKCDLVVKNH